MKRPWIFSFYIKYDSICFCSAPIWGHLFSILLCRFVGYTWTGMFTSRTLENQGLAWVRASKQFEGHIRFVLICVAWALYVFSLRSRGTWFSGKCPWIASRILSSTCQGASGGFSELGGTWATAWCLDVLNLYLVPPVRVLIIFIIITKVVQLD